MTLPAMIIHLERQQRRRDQCQRLLRELGPAARIMPAVDGRRLDNAALAACYRRSTATSYPFRLRPAEVATFLSHRRCWQAIVDQDLPAALVLEDDVSLGTGFAEACALGMAHLPDRGLIRFPVKPVERGSVLARSAGPEGPALIRPETVGLGMRAQIVTRDAAVQLLSCTRTFDRPVDTYMQLRWVHGVDVLSVWPSGVGEISCSLGGSTIHDRLSLRQRVRREVLRPLYRLSIALQSRRFRHDP